MKILLVDDDLSSLSAVKKYLENPLGYDVTAFESCDDAFKEFQQSDYKLVISDIKMRGMTGIDFLKKIKESDKGLKVDVILMTGFGELSTCMEALREGAADYLLKPISIRHLAEVLKRVQKQRKLLEENFTLKKKIAENQFTEEDLNFEKYLTENNKFGFFSKQIREIKDFCLKFHNKRKIPILIEGETGTGKEVFAHLIHNGETGSNRPFISVNCSAISPSLLESELFGYVAGAFTGAKNSGAKGKFEAANTGTIFLDEIGDMPLDMQPVLLRVLQEREIYRIGSNKPIPLDIRIIFATNKNLDEEVKKGNFREDLYYRISTGYVKIPPLRKRKAEIAPLAMMFLKKFSEENQCNFKAISRDALFMLEQYHFPGNIRELKNIIERAAIINENEEVLRMEHLKFLKFSYNMKENDIVTIDLSQEKHTMKDIQKIIVRKIYKKYNGNINKGAKFLKISWATFTKILNN